MLRGRASDERTLTMLAMRAAGWRDDLIAKALDTTPGTVSVTISKIKTADIRESGEPKDEVAECYRLRVTDYRSSHKNGRKGFGHSA